MRVAGPIALGCVVTVMGVVLLRQEFALGDARTLVRRLEKQPRAVVHGELDAARGAVSAFDSGLGVAGLALSLERGAWLSRADGGTPAAAARRVAAAARAQVLTGPLSGAAWCDLAQALLAGPGAVSGAERALIACYRAAPRDVALLSGRSRAALLTWEGLGSETRARALIDIAQALAAADTRRWTVDQLARTAAVLPERGKLIADMVRSYARESLAEYEGALAGYRARPSRAR